MLWVTRRWHTDAFVDSDEGVNGAEGNPFQKIRVCQSKQMSFFSTSDPHPPPPLLHPPQMQIVFESRLGAHDVLNDCTMTIDGTDFRIPQKGVLSVLAASDPLLDF